MTATTLSKVRWVNRTIIRRGGPPPPSPIHPVSERVSEARRSKRQLLFLQHLEQRRKHARLNAFITPLRDLDTPVKKQFRERRLPMHFLPSESLIAVKDNISYSALPTTCASQMLHGHKNPYDATVLKDFEREGAIIVGKTNMDEFGMGSHSTNSKYGAVQNVYQRSAGGSSGGSAVAVMTGQCCLALGTDTGGSVRLPAAYTGAIGYKPSYGRFSRWGLVPYANSLDTVGVLCAYEHRPRTRDKFFGENGLLLKLMDGLDTAQDDPDPTRLSKASRRRLQAAFPERHEKSQLHIGVPMEYNTQELSGKVRFAWQRVLENLQDMGARIVPISLPSTKHALSAYYIIAAAEAASNLAKYDGVRYGHRNEVCDGADGVLYSKTRGEGFGDEARRRILLGSYTLSSKAIDNYFLQAQKIRRLVQQDFDRVFSLPSGIQEPRPIDLSELDESISLEDKTGPVQVDLIICPTAPTSAPELHELEGQSRTEAFMNDVFTVPASLAGLPAVSIPVYAKEEDDVDSLRLREERIPYFQSGHVGIQVIGQYYDDDYVLSMAKRIMESFMAEADLKPQKSLTNPSLSHFG